LALVRAKARRARIIYARHYLNSIRDLLIWDAAYPVRDAVE
jgi:hypothetical protein